MSLSATYSAIQPNAQVEPPFANSIVEAARPHARAALGQPAGALNVTARVVEPSHARGGSLVPAWPIRQSDGSVVIEYVTDWGAFLSVWRSTAEEPSDQTPLFERLIGSRQRLWVGIANDVVQLFVPDPPPGTYSMVRHHALMLVAATLWLGPRAARDWHTAHASAGQAFLRRSAGAGLWPAVEAAERGLSTLLARPEARLDAGGVVAWLERDPSALTQYRDYLGAASLGVAALLSVALDQDANWLSDTMRSAHPDPDFNRAPIERFASLAAV
jgi:hypothetical protein